MDGLLMIEISIVGLIMIAEFHILNKKIKKLEAQLKNN